MKTELEVRIKHTGMLKRKIDLIHSIIVLTNDKAEDVLDDYSKPLSELNKDDVYTILQMAN